MKVFFDRNNAAPPADSLGHGWNDPDYAPGSAWYGAPTATPRSTWTTPCSLSGANHHWVAAFANAMPPTLADAYFLSSFTLPAGASAAPTTLILSGDNIVEAWFNGRSLGRFEGPYPDNSDSHLYERCVTVAVPASYFRSGVNTLAFRLINQKTSHGLTFELCGTYQAPCVLTSTSTGTSTSTATSTSTMTSTSTSTSTLISTSTSTSTSTATATSTSTQTPTATPPAASTPTAAFTAPLSTPVPTATFITCGPGSVPVLSWSTRTSMPVARNDFSLAVLDGVFYVAGGSNGSTLSNLEAYDPAADSWSEKAPLPTPRTFAGCGVVNGILYVISGNDPGNNLTAVMEAYDPATDHWTTKAPLPIARRGFGVGVVDGILYAFGGYSDSLGVLTDVEAYDPATDSWSARTPMTTGRYTFGTTVDNGKIYAVGGSTLSGYLTSLEVYDPAADSWSVKAPMFTPRYGLAFSPLEGSLYAIGGANATSALDNVESYDPAADSWTVRPPITSARWYMGSGTVGNHLFLIGGFNGAYLSVNEALGLECLAQPTATSTPCPLAGTAWTAATTSAAFGDRELGTHNAAAFNGKLWIVGGYDGSQLKNDVWSSTDGTNWTLEVPSAPFSPRTGHDLLVYDGKLWFIGGYDGSSYRNDVWSSPDGVNWTQATASAAFAASGYDCLVYGGKMWAIAGNNSATDVWYSTDGAVWTQASASADYPARGNFGSAVFDGKMWMVGGYNGISGFKSDSLYSTDGVHWTAAASLPFGGRAGFDLAVYEGRLWVLGGWNGSFFNDVWAFDGSSWTQVDGSAPFAPSYNQAAAVLNGRLWLIGGSADHAYYDDVWSTGCSAPPATATATATSTPSATPTTPLTPCAGLGVQWNLVSDPSALGPRAAHQMVVFHGRMWTLGGSVPGGSGIGHDVWSTEDGSHWDLVNASPEFPPVVGCGLLNFNDRLWIIAGQHPGGFGSNDVWSSADGVHWTQDTASADFAPRSGPGVLVFGGRMWVIGGATAVPGGSNFSDVWSSTDGAHWTLATASAPFGTRNNFECVEFNGRMWFTGGSGDPGDSSVWSSADGVHWTQESASEPFGRRFNYGTAVLDGRWWLVGGQGPGGAELNDTWYTSDGVHWTQASPSAPFQGRMNLACQAFAGKLWVSGGSSDGSLHSDLWSSACEGSESTPTPSPTATATETATPSATPTATATATEPCVVLINGAEDLDENGTWEGSASTRTLLNGAEAPLGALTQGQAVLKVDVNGFSGFNNQVLSLSGFQPQVWHGAAKLKLDLYVDPAVLAGAGNVHILLYGDSEPLGRTNIILSLDQPILVPGAQTLTWNFNNSPAVFDFTGPLTRLTFAFLADGAVQAGSLYLDNLRLADACGLNSALSATPTPTATASPSATPSSTATSTVTDSMTPSATASSTPTASATASWTASFTATASPSPTHTPSATPSSTATSTVTATVTSTPSSSPTATRSATPSATATVVRHCPPVPYPNPSHGERIRFSLGCGPYDRVDCRIYTLSFRCVHQKSLVSHETGQDALDWDLRDDRGARVANGLYYAVFRLEKDGRTETFTVKLLVLR